MNNKLNNKLELISSHLRKKTFLEFIKRGEAHLGGSFSMIEFLVYLFEKVVTKKDKIILSKSHASFPLCILLRQRGLRPKMTTHLEIDEKNGIYATTGSLGHGLPIAAGMAFSKKIQKKKGKIYVIISDGECQEGTTWETMLIASKHKLNNLVVLIDYNKIQALSRLNDALPLHDLKKKIISFNWNCINIKNGHSFNEISKSFKTRLKKDLPTAMLFNTIKGKGIKEFENDPVWHARKLQGAEMEIGKKRLKII